MDMGQIIKQAEENIRQAIRDYRAHTRQTEVLDDVSDEFIRTLARDSAHAKQGLRELFSKSPVWDEKIDALVINGTRTHNPDPEHIWDLGRRILSDVWYEHENDLADALALFSDRAQSDEAIQKSVAAINRLAPKAYAPTKKPSRVFKALCTALGVADESAGSYFQKMYAQFADELTAKKIGFKLYVSINPAHFISMSNPKGDKRGNTLTSCHSFNSTEYEYNNGCTGYARDGVSFVVFTVSDPTEPETLNNRKTTRQIFAYKPRNGLLLQSRMYNTSGGVYGASEDSKLYRDLVQREISMLENVPNLWKTHQYLNGHEYCVDIGNGFGGYADWTYTDFDGKVSIRNDHEDDFGPLEVGTWGLCIVCGCETSHGVYCGDCEQSSTCDDCGRRCDEDYLTRVVDSNGDEIWVCEDCRSENYAYCEDCERYVPDDDVEYIDGQDVCSSCRDEYYEECEDCNDWHRRNNMYRVNDSHGKEIWVCERCFGEYRYCDMCGEYYPLAVMLIAYRSNGSCVYICNNHEDEFDTCPHCGELVEMCDDGTCPHCGEAIEEDEEEAE